MYIFMLKKKTTIKKKNKRTIIIINKIFWKSLIKKLKADKYSWQISGEEGNSLLLSLKFIFAKLSCNLVMERAKKKKRKGVEER